MDGRQWEADRARLGGSVRLDRRAPAALAPLALDPQQRAIVEHRDGHLLVLAGPGTGKTATLAELVVARISDPVDRIPAERILALTFGRRASRELSERIGGRLGGGPVPVVSTFHAFAYGVLRQHSDPDAFASPPRLLVAAEQDARLREMLAHSIGEGRLKWPDSLARAVGTRGIAEQVRGLLSRARGLGLGGQQLSAIGRREGVPVWVALGGFLEEYLSTLGFEGSLDYSELILRAAILANDPRAGRSLREAYRLIVVDEYQDTDPAQVALLRGLAGGGAQVVVVGDPDQAIYGFRGADVRGILRFPDAFASPAGRPARIEVLRTTRRFPKGIARAAGGVLGPVSLAPLPAAVQRAHRTPIAADGPALVEVRTFQSEAAEAAGVAETLLRAHADAPGSPGLAWSQMAVLVRNPAVHGPVLARAIRAAGIPVWLPPDDLPLAEEPTVNLLLSVVGLALDAIGAPRETGRALLGGPIGRADAVSIRALARALLKERRGLDLGGPASSDAGDPEKAEKATDATRADGEPGRPSSDALLTAALARGSLPAHLVDAPRAAVTAFRRVARTVRAARVALDAGEMVSEVLWAVWRSTDWPERLRDAALRPGGGSAAASAHRDLDSAVALFELANRLPPQRRGEVGVAAFLEDVRALRLPQEVRGAPESGRDHVRLLSAHRAKGLEWELVVVAAVQEGQWPDVRLRSDLLRTAELGPTGRVEGQTHSNLLAEERRLMYVACTRARARLVVSAVAEHVDGGLQASRFLAELGQEIVAMPARSATPMSAEGLVAALREAAQSPRRVLANGRPDQAVEQLRGAAVQRLAALGLRAQTSGPLGPMAAADPSRWWGAQPLTGVGGRASGRDRALAAPVGEPLGTAEMRPLRLSPSAVAALRDCPLRWFLDRRVGAGNPSGGAAVVGLVVHAVAEALARGDIGPDPAGIGSFIDEIWASVPFPAHYQRINERRRVDEMTTALLAWDAASGRSVAAAELKFAVGVPGTSGPVEVTGSIDRVDRDFDGRIHVVDFKTGRTAASAAATAEHPQLGIYQLAIRLGALETDTGGTERVTDPPSSLGEAELVHLADRFASGLPKVRLQAALDEGWTWVNDLIVEAARLAAGPQYPARPNGHCGSCAFRFMCPAHVPAPVSGPSDAPPPAPGLPPGEAPGPSTSPRGTRDPRTAEHQRDSPRPNPPARPIQQSLWGEDDGDDAEAGGGP